jgi:hypothetical protein
MSLSSRILGTGEPLALSLAKRARELLIGLPGLVAWQLTTGAWLERPSGAGGTC